MSRHFNIFVVLLVAHQGYCLPQREFLGRSSSTRVLDCSDFVLDKCTIELEGFIETVKDLTEENCQRYCNVVYPGRCQVWKSCNIVMSKANLPNLNWNISSSSFTTESKGFATFSPKTSTASQKHVWKYLAQKNPLLKRASPTLSLVM